MKFEKGALKREITNLKEKAIVLTLNIGEMGERNCKLSEENDDLRTKLKEGLESFKRENSVLKKEMDTLGGAMAKKEKEMNSLFITCEKEKVKAKKLKESLELLKTENEKLKRENNSQNRKTKKREKKESENQSSGPTQTKKLEAMQLRIEGLKKELEKEKEKREEAEMNTEDIQAALEDAHKQLTPSQRKRGINEDSEELRDENENYKHEIRKMEVEIEDLRGKNGFLEDKLIRAHAMLKKERKRLKWLEEKNKARERREKVKGWGNTPQKTEKSHESRESKSLKRQRKELGENLAMMHTQVEEYRKKLGKANQKMSSLAKERDACKKEVEVLKKKLNQKMVTLSKTHGKMQGLQAKVESFRQSNSDLRERLESDITRMPLTHVLRGLQVGHRPVPEVREYIWKFFGNHKNLEYVQIIEKGRGVRCKEQKWSREDARARSDKSFSKGVYACKIELVHPGHLMEGSVGIRAKGGSYYWYGGDGGFGIDDRALSLHPFAISMIKSVPRWWKKGQTVTILLDCDRNEVGFWRGRLHVCTLSMREAQEYFLEIYLEPSPNVTYRFTID